MFGLIILERMCAGIEGKLHKNREGFRSGRGYVGKILCLRMLTEKCVEFQLPALAIFVDFNAVFDSIHRPSVAYSRRLWDPCVRVPAKYVQLIRCVYEICKAAVTVEGERPEWCRVETGVRQGCVWSPLLFGVMIDFVLHMRPTFCRDMFGRREAHISGD